jgi:rhamnulose-1-phosphate aldolase
MLIEGLDAHLDAVRRVAGYLWDKGWAERNAGNLSIDVTASIRVPEAPGTSVRVLRPLKEPSPELGGRSLWITATGSRMGSLASDPAPP